MMTHQMAITKTMTDRVEEKDKLLYVSLGLDENKKVSEDELYKKCRELLDRSSVALKDYALKINTHKFVLGLSGGLDSSFVAIAARGALKMMGDDEKNLILVTLPGFGTGKTTFSNSLALIESVNATHINIDIKDVAKAAMKDLNLHEDNRTTAFENIQARLRTVYLLTLANMEGALELGTGDFSESALGWCTYGGDNISMYNINALLPKTLLRATLSLIGKYERKPYLTRIAETPITPELLASNPGEEFSQKTEDIIGSYNLIDYLLYLVTVKGMEIDDAVIRAKETMRDFDGLSVNGKSYIDHYGSVFKKRYLTQGFKRLNCPYPTLTSLHF